MKSRYRGGKHHHIFVLVDKSKTGIYAIREYCCTCESGSRTVGCCSHLMTIVWFLGRTSIPRGRALLRRATTPSQHPRDSDSIATTSPCYLDLRAEPRTRNYVPGPSPFASNPVAPTTALIHCFTPDNFAQVNSASRRPRAAPFPRCATLLTLRRLSTSAGNSISARALAAPRRRPSPNQDQA